MSSFTERMIRAARLDAQLYEEVEADQTAMGQAMGVVVLSSVATGIGMIGITGAIGIVVGTIGALVGWYIWALLTYYIGTRLLPGPQTQADVGQLLRTTGFSSTPGLLRIFGIISPLNSIVQVVTGVWMLIAMVVAVRQALDYETTGRAVAVCVVGFIVQILVLALIFALLGGHP